MPARPTLRCLREDLQTDWGDNQQRIAALAAEPRLPALHSLDQDVIRHAASIFTGNPNATPQRESISGLSDPVWWKLKTGRWRGAVYEDANGQAWLCAAGLRYEGESKDFYKTFMGDVVAYGPEHFMPTEEDHQLLRRELALADLEQWERGVHAAASHAFAAAALEGKAEFVVNDIVESDTSISRVRVEVEVLRDEGEDEDGLAEVVLTFHRMNWAKIALAEHADLLVLTAIQPAEQAWDTSATANGPIYSLLLPEHELQQLLDQRDAEGEPGQSTPGTCAHFAHRERLTESTVEGNAVRGLCGVWFVPRQDHENLETCPKCDAIHKSLQAGP